MIVARWVLPPVVLVLSVCGCSSAPQENVDATSIIQPMTRKLTELGLAVKGVNCPPNVARAAGSSFQCTVTTDTGATFAVNVTQKDEGGQLKLAWETGKDLIISDRYRTDLTNYAHSISADLTVTCPPATIMSGGNGTLSCEVKDANGQTGKLVVPMKDGAPVADKQQWSINQ